MKPTETFHNLRHFFGCYFHQDWMDEYENEEMAVKGYVDDDGQEDANNVVHELDQLLSQGLSETALRKVMEDDLGCEYNPDPDSVSMNAWLLWVRSTLIKYCQPKQG